MMSRVQIALIFFDIKANGVVDAEVGNEAELGVDDLCVLSLPEVRKLT